MASRSNYTTMYINASPWCARKVKDCIIVTCAPPLTLCTSFIRPFASCPPICVRIILYACIYIYTPAFARRPPPQKNTHKVVYLRTHRLQKKRKDSNKERETKRDREEVFGGWSLEICSGWLSGPHVQVLEACLLRSLRTCPVTSKNGMFQAQRSRDN